MTGLAEYEGHYALYPPGASYARHRDRFRDDDTRVLSCVLYLNEGWRREDGGALRLYVEGGRAIDVRPEGGTLVAFLSGRFDHEVLPARRPRLALTGWFRRRPLASGQGAPHARIFPRAFLRAASPGRVHSNDRFPPMPSAHAPRRLTIATRESALAMWQAEHIRARLAGLYPGTSISLLGMTTKGDQILDQPLTAIGGKGLFIKELEVAMAEGRADLAVHSLKDVPMEMPPGFALASIAAREDPRDAFVSNRYGAAVRVAGRRDRRDVEPPARSATARAPSVARDPAAARQRQHAAAQARRRTVRRDHPRRRRLEAPRVRLAHRVAARSRRKPARAGTGRARHRMPQRPPRPHRRARGARRPRDDARDDRGARVLARARAAAATRRWPATPNGKRVRCGCAACSRAATAATSCAASSMRTSPTPRVPSSWAGRSPTISWRAAPPGSSPNKRAPWACIRSRSAQRLPGRSRASASSSRGRRARRPAWSRSSRRSARRRSCFRRS